jgi:hypothetical protein
VKTRGIVLSRYVRDTDRFVVSFVTGFPVQTDEEVLDYLKLEGQIPVTDARSAAYWAWMAIAGPDNAATCWSVYDRETGSHCEIAMRDIQGDLDEYPCLVCRHSLESWHFGKTDGAAGCAFAGCDCTEQLFDV